MHFSKPPLGTPLDWGNPLNDGTVLALAMNEGHGDKVQDLSLNGNHGTLKNMAFPSTAASGWNPGHTGVGLNFDVAGSNYIDCGDKDTLNGVDTLFLSALCNPTSGAATYITLIGKYADVNNWLYWRIHSITYHLEVYWFTGGVGSGGIPSTVPVPADTWSHCAMDVDGTSVTMYINGIACGGGNAAVGLPDAPRTYIGQRGDDDRYFGGGIDQPRIQSRAWTAKEVKDYYINPWQVYLDE